MKAKIPALILTFFAISSLFVVFGQTVDTTNVVSTVGTTDTSSEVATETFSCEEITAEIDSRITQYKTDEPAHTAAYQMLYLKVDATAKKAKVLGYDTTKLEKNLVELDKLIKEFGTNFNSFVVKFEATKKYACNVSNDALYAKSFIETVGALGKVRATTSEIYNLYQDEIRENILGLEMLLNGQ